MNDYCPDTPCHSQRQSLKLQSHWQCRCSLPIPACAQAVLALRFPGRAGSPVLTVGLDLNERFCGEEINSSTVLTRETPDICSCCAPPRVCAVESGRPLILFRRKAVSTLACKHNKCKKVVGRHLLRKPGPRSKSSSSSLMRAGLQAQKTAVCSTYSVCGRASFYFCRSTRRISLLIMSPGWTEKTTFQPGLNLETASKD